MLNFYRYLIENVDPENLPSKETVEKIAHHAIESRMDPPSSLGELKALHLIAEEDLGSEIGSEIESCSILERMAMIEAVRNRINQILSNEGKDANYNKKKTGKKPSSRRN